MGKQISHIDVTSGDNNIYLAWSVH